MDGFSTETQQAQQAPGQKQDQPAPSDNISVLGHVLWLMSQSPIHKHMFVSDFEWLVMPAILHGQFRIWREKNAQGVLIPVAYASWAYLDEAAEQRIRQSIKRLAPTDWKSGTNLWLIDLIAPFGGADKAVKELKEKILKGQTIKSIQPNPAGGTAVMEW